MRYAFIWLLLLNAIHLSSFAQAPANTKPASKTIIYDFKTKELGIKNGTALDDLPTLSAGGKFIVKVINVNRYLYQVGIKVNNEEFVAKPPALLAGLLGTSGDLAAAISKLNLGGVAAAISGGAAAGQLSPLQNIATLYINLEALEKEIAVDELKTYDSHLLRNGSLTAPDFSTISTKLENSLKQCADFEDAYYTALAKADKDVLIKALQDVKQAYDKHNFADRFRDYAKLKLNLTDENFNFFTRELTADIDVMHVAIGIVPRELKEPSFFIPLETDSLKFDISVKQQRGRLSFSQGLFISGITNDEYAYKSNLASGVDTVTSYQIVSEKPRHSSVGVVAMAHYTWGSDKHRGGFHLGVGVPIEKQLNGQIFAGATYAISLEGKNKLFFNLGPVLGLVRTISSTYQASEKFKTTSTPIPYTQSMNVRFAFSVTFNFF